MKSAPQYPLAVDKAVWQGEPVVAVVAESRALAEDGCARVRVTWEPLPPVVDAEAALAPGRAAHPSGARRQPRARDARSSRATWTRRSGGRRRYRDTFDTGRHTVVSLEPRVVLADYDPADETLTVYHSGQAPYMLHDILSRHLGIPEHRVRVINKDVGGSFGLKIHTYPDEIATCALAVMLGRPVKFLADRIESFQTDIHSRDHRVTAEVAVKRDGTILGMRLDDLAPRRPLLDVPALERRRERPGRCAPRRAPYRFRDYEARGRVVFQNKTPMSQYRAVGHPVAALVMEAMVDRVARELGARSRRGAPPQPPHRRHVSRTPRPPGSSSRSSRTRSRSTRCWSCRATARSARSATGCARAGVYRGLGLCVFIDLTVPGAQTLRHRRRAHLVAGRHARSGSSRAAS